MSKIVLILLAYNILFFWKFYKNPFINFTGEVASTYFPHWVWASRQWLKGKIPMKDDIYYKEPGAIPFLSTFYPFDVLTGLISHKMSLNSRFKLYNMIIIGHYIIASINAFLAIYLWSNTYVALFGAISLTYCAYNIKPQSPMAVYTHAWIPGMLVGGWYGALCCGLAVLAGYWPITIYFLPIAAFLHPEILLGLVLGLPQIIPFIPYWKKSVRHKQKQTNFGSVILWDFLNLVKGNRRKNSSGILFPEKVMYLGLLPLFLMLFATSNMWLVLISSVFLSMGILKVPFRIPARFIHLISFSIIWLACNGLNNLHLSQSAIFALILIQAFDLLQNRDIFPMWPFCEMTNKPEEVYNTTLTAYLEKHLGNNRVSGLPHPLFTGYIHEFKTLGYNGGFQTKEMSDFREDKDPNGSGAHDWFKTLKDGKKLNEYGVKFAYKPQGKLIRGKWKTTSVPNLFENLQVATI